MRLPEQGGIRPAAGPQPWALVGATVPTCLVLAAFLWPRPVAECTLHSRLVLQSATPGQAYAVAGDDIQELCERQAAAYGLDPSVVVTVAEGHRGTVVSLDVRSRSPYRDRQRLERLVDSVANAAPAYLVQRQLMLTEPGSSEEERAWRELRDRLIGYVTTVRRAINDQWVTSTERPAEVSIPVSTNGGDSTPLNPRWLELSQQLDQERDQLGVLLEKYTDRHPDVIKRNARISALKGELDQVPMLMPTPKTASGSAEVVGHRRPSTTELADWKDHLADLDEAERSLYMTLDDFAAARTASPPVSSAPALWLVESAQKPVVVARHGGLSPLNWLALCLFSVMVSCGMLGAVASPAPGVLGDVTQLTTTWQTTVIGTVGHLRRRLIGAQWLATWYRVARLLAACAGIGVLVMAILDGNFLSNLVHEPRMAVAEVLVRQWGGSN